jgi:hypothetical protein
VTARLAAVFFELPMRTIASKALSALSGKCDIDHHLDENLSKDA